MSGGESRRRFARARVAVALVAAGGACAVFSGIMPFSDGRDSGADTSATRVTAPGGEAGAADSSSPWRPPRTRSARERADDREEMVLRQIESPGWSRNAVVDTAVLRAMRTAPRHVFVPRDLARQAYNDTPLPIGHGQTISQPYIVAVMTELLELTPASSVLEIGTGSGYQAAVLAHITPHVYTIEILEPLATGAAAILSREGYDDIQVRHGDGYYGWPEAAPFDAIIVTCAAGHLPPPLWEQLKPGGRIVIPIGGAYSVQRLVVAEKTDEGKRRTRAVMDVRFVPMTGRSREE
jgi:protein-L-isoaspartate(D-aspartate) O-methyltransferase